MQRAFAFLLFASILLLPAVAPAQTWTPAPARVISLGSNDLNWHTITFQYAKPGDVLKLVGWGSGSPAVGTQPLPPGVERVLVVPQTNSLIVQATDKGFHRFHTIIADVLNIRPDRVRFKVLLADIPAGHKVNVDHIDPHQLMEQLQDANATSIYLKQTSADDRGYASFALDRFAVTYHDVKGNTIRMSPTLDISSRAYMDGSVSLNFSISVPDATTPSTMLPPKYYVMYMSPIKGTVTSEITGQLPSTGHRVFIFMTPTIVKPSVNNGQAITLTP